MSGSLYSASWHRVADLKPELRAHARLHRHNYRGERWYVLQDHAKGGACHRLSPSAHALVALMDGVRTTQEIWDAALEMLGDDAPTQDETIRLLGLLHQADVLRTDVVPETAEVLARCQRRETADWWRQLLNPLSFRLPLVDPDAFLDRFVPLVAPVFTKAGGAAWIALVLIAILVAASHAEELANAELGSLLSGGNLLALWLVFPVVKLLHEFGHAFAAKVWGAEVHEMGVMFLVLMPVPYVDASASAVFPDKQRRMVVAGAGIAVELALASLALFIWLSVEPGITKSLAFNVMVIASFSTLLFNGNPLLRFDGYFVLSDAIEIPNLATRSKQYLSYVLENGVFGIDATRNPVAAPGERFWFTVYGISSSIYRVALVLGIALFIADKFFVIGVLIAISSIVSQILLPVARRVHFILTSPRVGDHRFRAVATSFGGALAVISFLCLVPVPLHTVAEGVIFLPETARVRAGTDAFVTEVLVEPGTRVEAGQPLVATRDPFLETNVRAIEAELAALRARRHALSQTDLVRAQITDEEIRTTEARLQRAEQRSADSVLRGTSAGTFVMPGTDVRGRFVKQGEVVGYVVGHDAPIARVVVSQADVSTIRERTEAVEVRLASRVRDVIPATIARAVPGASTRLPSPALGSEGGGIYPVDPSDPTRLANVQPVFQFDLELAASAAAEAIGQRVYVRFDHGSEPLARRAYRAARRLLLSRLDV